MKKLYLQKNVQHHTVSYVGTISSRDLVRLAKNIEIGAEQDAQRPLTEKKVKQIAEHISSGDDGLLPGSIVIATTSKILEIHEATESGIPNLYYVDFPETDSEFLPYIGSIEVMDGQHRLFSFKENMILLDDNIPFDLSFSMYIQPTLRERRIIFKVANEKQDKVSPNLLMWIRSQLGLLSGAEKEFQPLIQLLNTENCSPLRGRIITGAERIRYGIMAQQLIKIFSKSKLSSLSLKGKTLDNETRLTLICTYLKGWQKATGCDFSTQQREFGPLTKISGIRYILFLLPAFYDTIIQKRLKFDECDLASMIVNLYRQFGTTPKDFFDPNSSFNADNPDSLLAFRSEGATTTLAETHAAMIKNMDSDDYDPFH